MRVASLVLPWRCLVSKQEMNKYNVTRPTATLHLHPDATLSFLRSCLRSAVPRRCPRFGRPLVSASATSRGWGGSCDIPDSLASRNDGPHLALSSKSGRYLVTWETSFLTAFGVPLVFCGLIRAFLLIAEYKGNTVWCTRMEEWGFCS